MFPYSPAAEAVLTMRPNWHKPTHSQVDIVNLTCCLRKIGQHAFVQLYAPFR